MPQIQILRVSHSTINVSFVSFSVLFTSNTALFFNTQYCQASITINLPSNMQNPSVFLYGPQVAKIEDSSYPTIKDQNDVIIRIACVGVCGSDVCSPFS
jgi:hypothetical protein